MARYKIGNILRGYLYLPAKTHREAWDAGRAAFNAACPTDSKSGRQIELYVEKSILVTERYEEYDSDPKGWFPVLVGFSKDPYPTPPEKPKM